jgi:hypothetical protein
MGERYLAPLRRPPPISEHRGKIPGACRRLGHSSVKPWGDRARTPAIQRRQQREGVYVGVGASEWNAPSVRPTIPRNGGVLGWQNEDGLDDSAEVALLASRSLAPTVIRHRPLLRVISSAYPTKRENAFITAARSSRPLLGSQPSSTNPEISLG